MRYCNNCHRLTIGDPLYCNFCGSSYDLKLCPARHPNPRTADVCSQCGSREFSTPAPRMPLWVLALLHVLSILPGIVLLLLSVMFLVGLVQVVLTNQQVQFQMLMAGLMIALLWWLYMQMPPFIRKLFKTIWPGKNKSSTRH